MSKADKRARKKERAREAQEARLRAQKRSKQRKTALRVGAVAVVFAAIFGAFSYFGDDEEKASETTPAPTTTTPVATTTTLALGEYPEGCTDEVPEAPDVPRSFDAAPAMQIDPAKFYSAKITTSCGEITALLDAANAPQAVNNFVFLARQQFYDGLTWHRVIADFVVQGGDPNGDGSGGPGYSVAGEAPVAGDGYPEGALAAAKQDEEPAGTMGSQFFMVTGVNGTELPPDYARFGLITDGLDVAKTLERFATPETTPSNPIYIFKIEITETDAPPPTTATTAGPTETTTATTAAPTETTIPAETTTTAG